MQGFWISPDRERVPAVEHALALQQQPGAFGLADREVRGASLEGLRALAEALIADGWIRARYLDGVWNFEARSPTPHVMESIDALLAAESAYPHEEVAIEAQSPSCSYRGTVAEHRDRSILARASEAGTGWRISRA